MCGANDGIIPSQVNVIFYYHKMARFIPSPIPPAALDLEQVT